MTIVTLSSLCPEALFPLKDAPLGMNESFQSPCKCSAGLPSKSARPACKLRGRRVSPGHQPGGAHGGWGWILWMLGPGSPQSDLPQTTITHPRWAIQWIPERVIQIRRGISGELNLGSHCFCWLTIIPPSWTFFLPTPSLEDETKYTQRSHYKAHLLENFSKYCTTPLSTVRKILGLFHSLKTFFISLMIHHFRYKWLGQKFIESKKKTVLNLYLYLHLLELFREPVLHSAIEKKNSKRK